MFSWARNQWKWLLERERQHTGHFILEVEGDKSGRACSASDVSVRITDTGTLDQERNESHMQAVCLGILTTYFNKFISGSSVAFP